jgi:multiple sugar transport system permease protein
MKEKRKNKLLIYLGMLVVAIYLTAPIIWIVMMSFKNKFDVTSMPPKIFFTPTLENYKA